MKFLLFPLLILLPYLAVAQLHFSDLAAEAGINHSYLSNRLGGGVSWQDFDGDGYDDLTIATAEGETIHFYQNQGDSTFLRLPDLVETEEEAKQILWVDFDNDGDQDLFVATFNGLNRLYEQTDTLVFTDITVAAGLFPFFTNTYGACFGDYDRDGWIDLYFGLRLTAAEGGNQHQLFRNNGDGTFSNTTTISQTNDSGGVPFCSGFLDYNLDGWPDLYTAHDRYPNPNTLLENQGDGTFRNRGMAAGADFAIDAMSVTVGDYNNDSLPDIYCTNTTEGSILLRNEGPNDTLQYTFSEQAPAAGVGFYGVGWSASYLDADNDCDLDLYISGAAVGSDAISAAFYRNEADGTFSEPEAGFVGDTSITYNNAVGDYDYDGAPDLLVVNVFPFSTQLWSSEAGPNNWLKIKLQGVSSNRDAIGTLLECYSANGQYQQRYTQCGSGFLGQHSGTQNIGLGAAEQLDSLVIHWPNGQVDRYYELAGRQTLRFVEGEGFSEDPPGPEPEEPTSATTLLTEPQLRLYPSPVVRQLLLSQAEMRYEHYQIIDAQGRTLHTGQLRTQRQRIPVAELPAGTYYLRINGPQIAQKTLPWVKI